MFDDIETRKFLRFVSAGFHKGMDQLIEHEGTGDGQSVSHDDGDELRGEQMGVTVEEAVGTVGIDFRGSPKTGSDSTPGAADAMDTESVKRIIITELFLEHSHSEVADNAADETDDYGRHGSHEAGGRGDGYKTGNGAGDST